MREALETADLAVLNDLGVGWRHNSEPYLSHIRFPQFCDTPVAKWPVTEQFESERDSRVVGFSDPLARELYVSDTVRKHATIQEKITTPQEAWASSILRVHEPIHAGLADQFTHLYGQPRLLSFTRTLRFIHEGPDRGARTIGKRVLEPLLNDAWATLQQSEFVQEATALRAQRNFLKQYTHPGCSPEWQETVQNTRWHRLIEQSLEEGGPSGITPDANKTDFETVIGHALGDWLGEQVRTQPWAGGIDPLDIAFRFHIPATKDDGGGTAPPDVVLLAAASISAGELAELDAQSQLALLIDRVENRQEVSYDTVVAQPGLRSELLPADRQPIDPDEAFNIWREVNYYRNVDSSDWYIVPLNATVYPGKSTKSESTLWDLLNGLASDVVQQDGKSVRRLWLETEYEWATDTPLLAMAVQLWHLRDQTLLSLIRAYERNKDVNVDAHLADARDILDGRIPPGRIWGRVNPDDTFDDHARRLHNQTPAIRDRYGALFDQLKTLGKAIHEEDPAVVERFYRS